MCYDPQVADGLCNVFITKVAVFVLMSPRPLGIAGQGKPVS